MKLTAQIKLQPTPEQASALKRTLETANAACDYISAVAWESKIFGQYKLHHLAYAEVRTKFGLSAQMTVRCIAKVADAYKLDKETKRTFKPTGSIAYDERILSWKIKQSYAHGTPGWGTVSIWTMDGRMTIPFVCGERQRELLQTRQGESDLATANGNYFLFATCNVEEPAPIEFTEVLGVDTGIVNIATDSDGEVHSGKTVNNVRFRHRHLRQKLQRKGTKSAKRRLRKLSGKEQRFGKWVNHNISKRIVAKAQHTRRAIGFENLEGITDRVRVRKSQKATLHSWSFYQLNVFTQYKAQRAGIAVIYVDPRNTSRTCPSCGCIDKANRPNQATFLCTSCGFSGHADRIAARNIASRAVVNQLHVSDAHTALSTQRQGQGSGFYPGVIYGHFTCVRC